MADRFFGDIIHVIRNCGKQKLHSDHNRQRRKDEFVLGHRNWSEDDAFELGLQVLRTNVERIFKIAA